MHDVERLFREYHAMLVRYLTRRLGDRDWAEEVAQEVFVRALRQESIANERSWLFAVANNLVRDDARRATRQRRHLELMVAEAREQEQEPAEDAAESTLERAQESADARRETGCRRTPRPRVAPAVGGRTGRHARAHSLDASCNSCGARWPGR